ncbi:hypothetical protein K491DRAFT_675312 [Lophiostoma macrostomum CBS 122681]|uniref:Uncharacterized protein n=1 Tax=Lophiostoma macrostomum CBS 122681 TaxID=1314788 RepID=A0A6A6TKS6_9PLEO|nr:hypothetical protein K491DRAFT_675312 [Lophiostoma macrostomum CBS 122681]
MTHPQKSGRGLYPLSIPYARLGPLSPPNIPLPSSRDSSVAPLPEHPSSSPQLERLYLYGPPTPYASEYSSEDLDLDTSTQRIPRPQHRGNTLSLRHHSESHSRGRQPRSSSHHEPPLERRSTQRPLSPPPHYPRPSDSNPSSSNSSPISFRCLTSRGVETFDFARPQTFAACMSTPPDTPRTPGGTHVRFQPPSSHPHPDTDPRRRVCTPTPHPSPPSPPPAYTPRAPQPGEEYHSRGRLGSRIHAIPQSFRSHLHREDATLSTHAHAHAGPSTAHNSNSNSNINSHSHSPASFPRPLTRSEATGYYYPIRPNRHSPSPPPADGGPRWRETAAADLFFNSTMTVEEGQARCPREGCGGALVWAEGWRNRVKCVKCRKHQDPVCGDLEALDM